MANYVYFGKCEDGRYWLIWKGLLRYVERDLKTGKIMTRTFAKIEDVLRDRNLLDQLPPRVREWILKFYGRSFTLVKIKCRVVNIVFKTCVITYTLAGVKMDVTGSCGRQSSDTCTMIQGQGRQ